MRIEKRQSFISLLQRFFISKGLISPCCCKQDKGLRILAESPALPPYNIAAKGNIDDDTLAKLKDAFLSLDRNNPEHLKVIKAIDKKYDGFAATSDAEYDVVRELIKPFNK